MLNAVFNCDLFCLEEKFSLDFVRFVTSGTSVATSFLKAKLSRRMSGWDKCMTFEAKTLNEVT